MKTSYVNPVTSDSAIRNYPAPILNTSEKLEAVLRKAKLDITLGKPLKGGVASQVYEAVFSGEKVVVKHTENICPFDPTEIFISRKGHNEDTKILKKLAGSSQVRVPQVIKFYPEITTTIMQDMRLAGFELFQDLIFAKKLPLNSAAKIGKALANLALETRSWEEFPTNESARQSIYERGLELRLAYPNSQSQYLELEKEFVENSKYWMWPDGHPKNAFVNAAGEVAFIDFGRSVWADQRYMLPNFLSHIAIYYLAGYYSKKEAVTFIHDCVEAYRALEPIDEAIFCKYFGMEVLHRENGKWLGGITTSAQKVLLEGFGLAIFDNNIIKVKELLELLAM